MVGHGGSVIEVEGGPLRGGDVPIAGYKHAFTTVLAAALALGRRATLRNVPETTETNVLHEMIGHLGAGGAVDRGRWEIEGAALRPGPLSPALSGRIHGSLYLAPALLARFGVVEFPGAGGDRIGPSASGGARPTEQVCDVMERFGARVLRRGQGAFAAEAPAGLRGCTIDMLDFSTDPARLRGPRASSATKTALILAAAARTPSVLRHPVARDATWELVAFLEACGCRVAEVGDGWYVQPGAGPAVVDHELISDSTEIVTFVACAVRCGVPLRLTGLTVDRTRAALAGEAAALERMGVSLQWGDTWVSVRPPERLRPLTIEIECCGFSTDAHPLFTLMLLGATGESRLTDHVWTSRFAYLDLLKEMGARARVLGNTVHIEPGPLVAPLEPLLPRDSRAAAVAVLAALGVDGRTTIVDREHLDRGYDRLVDKLASLGARLAAVTPRRQMAAASPAATG